MEKIHETIYTRTVPFKLVIFKKDDRLVAKLKAQIDLQEEAENRLQSIVGNELTFEKELDATFDDHISIYKMEDT